MELVPTIRSNPSLSLNNKTKICNILARYPESEHNSLVLELIDSFSAGEFDLMNKEELQDLLYDIKKFKEDFMDIHDVRSTAAVVAEDVVRHYNFETLKHIKDVTEAHKDLEFFKKQAETLREYTEEINTNLKAINESILALVEFIDTRKSVNLRAKSNKPKILLDKIQKNLNRITPINLRKSE